MDRGRGRGGFRGRGGGRGGRGRGSKKFDVGSIHIAGVAEARSNSAPKFNKHQTSSKLEYTDDKPDFLKKLLAAKGGASDDEKAAQWRAVQDRLAQQATLGDKKRALDADDADEDDDDVVRDAKAAAMAEFSAQQKAIYGDDWDVTLTDAENRARLKAKKEAAEEEALGKHVFRKKTDEEQAKKKTTTTTKKQKVVASALSFDLDD